MSFFNFRRGGSSAAPPAGPAAQPESVEAIRKRARHRLIGAIVLVLLGVVGFPLLFDTQPRPIPVDIPIEIPAKNAVKPLLVPAPPAATEAASVPAAASLAPKEEIAPSKQVPAPVQQAPEAIKKEVKPDLETQAKTEPKAASRAASSGNDAARASALLNGQPVPPVSKTAAAAEGRVVVQVGAFADAAKAREVRAKLEKAGLKTYAQVVETRDGARTRVRVGPFSSRAEAEKVAGKIKALDLPTAILSL